MSFASVDRVVPWALLVGGVGLLAAWFVGALRAGLRRRPAWLVAVALGALPALDVGLVWARVLPESYLRFERPYLAVVSLLACAYAASRSLGGGVRVGPFRTHVGDGLTALAVLATSLAAAGPEVGLPLDRLTVVLVVDRSRSMDLVPSLEERLQRELAIAEGRMRPDDRLGRVVFGATSATEELPRESRVPSSPQRVEVGRDATDVASGIRRGLADLPADTAARLVVLSDGVATRGDAPAAAAAAVAGGIPIDVVTLEQRELRDVRLVSLRAPSTANEAEDVRLRVVVSAPSEAEVELRVRRDGILVRRVHARLEAGENPLVLREESPGAGLHRFDVEVSALDASLDESAEDNAQSTFVRVRGPARALVVDGDDGMTAFVAGALRAAKLEVVEGGLSSVPADVAGMAAFDVIVFGDIPAAQLAPGQIDALAGYVSELGGGLVWLGGDRSFGPGGYARTPLEDVSPVSFDLKQDRRRASLAEVIAIDISGSMAAQVGGKTKLELANEASARSAALLGGGDRLGVDHVDTVSHWSVPLGPLTDRGAVDKAIRARGPGGGGILVDVALHDAYAALASESVNLKHVLLFADGADAENISPSVDAAVVAAYARGITTSVVALGQGPDVPACENLSRLGHGRFYIVEDATRLPAIFTQETILASRSALVEERFRVAATARHPVLQGVDVGAAPELGGYVVTIAKPRADVLLTGPESDPVLAVWQAGIGRAAVFTSDLKARWGAAWTQWEGAARLVAQTAQYVARREDDRRVRLEAEAQGGQLELRATVVDDDGRLATFRRLAAQVRGPDGFSREVPLEAAGAGSYRASLPLGPPGAYVATALDEVDGGVVATAGAALGRGDELRPTGSDGAFLGRLADLTGGKRRDTLAGLFDDRGPRRYAYERATTWCIVTAAVAWLLAVAVRRLAALDAIPARLRRVLGSRARPPASGAVRSTSDETLAVLLRNRKEGAQAEAGADGLADPRRLRDAANAGVRTSGETPPVVGAAPPFPAPQAPPPGWSPAPTSEVMPPQVAGSPSVTGAVAATEGRAAATESTGAEAERGLSAAEILLARRKNRR